MESNNYNIRKRKLGENVQVVLTDVRPRLP